MEEGFKSIDEILEEVAKDENMTVAEVKDLWKHQKKYVQQQMDTEGVYSIFLPFVGTLSMNMKQFKKELKGKTREVYKDFISKAEKLENHENYAQYGNAHKKVTGVNRLARQIISKYETGINKSRNLLLHAKCWDVIAKYSNGVFEKREEPIKRKKK